MSRPAYQTYNTKRANFRYWWNLFSFDVYCAYREGNREKYNEAMHILKEYEALIQERYPAMLYTLKRPVEWS